MLQTSTGKQFAQRKYWQHNKHSSSKYLGKGAGQFPYSLMEEPKQQIPVTSRERQLAGLRPVQPGQVLNPNGKKPGTLNRITQETKELLAHAAQKNLPAVNNAIDTLLKSDNEFVRSRGVELFLRLLEFSQPRLSAMAVKGDGVSTGIIVIGKPADLELSNTDTIEEASVIEDTSTGEGNNLNDDAHE